MINNGSDYTKLTEAEMNKILLVNDLLNDEKEIHDFDDYDIDKIKNFFEKISDDFLFSEGVKELCKKKGYTGDGKRRSYIAFIMKLAIEKKVLSLDEEESFRQTLRNWLKDEKPIIPDDNIRSRRNVYKLCFALGLSAEEVKTFFMKKYLCMPFNLRSIEETVYYYSLSNKLGYKQARDILAECKENIDSNRNTDDRDNTIYTKSFFYIEALKQDITALDKKEFIGYCIQNRNYFYQNKETAVKIIRKLLKIIEASIDSYNNMGKVNISKTLDLIYYGKDNGIAEAINYKYKFGKDKVRALPEKISKNMPNNKVIENIYKGENVTPDVLRKTLILLFFYCFYMDEDEEKKFDNFVKGLDDTLLRCGFAKSYIRNPYDAMFYLCAKHNDVDSEFGPIEVFQQLVMYYTKNSDV